MPPKLERFLNRLLLVLIASSAIVMADGYDDPAQLFLYLLAAVALGGLLAPVPVSRPDLERRERPPRR